MNQTRSMMKAARSVTTLLRPCVSGESSDSCGAAFDDAAASGSRGRRQRLDTDAALGRRGELARALETARARKCLGDARALPLC